MSRSRGRGRGEGGESVLVFVRIVSVVGLSSSVGRTDSGRGPVNVKDSVYRLLIIVIYWTATSRRAKMSGHYVAASCKVFAWRFYQRVNIMRAIDDMCSPVAGEFHVFRESRWIEREREREKVGSRCCWNGSWKYSGNYDWELLTNAHAGIRRKHIFARLSG